MKQIDQDPGQYRIQRPDGSWGQRVDKPMARILAVICIILLTWLGVANMQDGTELMRFLPFAIVGFLIGALVTLSLRSIDW